MNVAKQILVVADDSLFAGDIAQDIKQAFPEEMAVKHCSFDDIMKQSNEEVPFLVFVDVRKSTDNLKKAAEQISDHFAECPIIGLGYPSDVQQILDFIKIGVRDFLNLPLRREELLLLYNQSRTTAPTPQKSGISGKIIVIYSPKGGTGATLISVNLAVAMAQKHPNAVAICDLSLEVGDVTTQLNLSPKYTIRDILDNDRRIDSSFLKGVMLEHSSGVHVLPTTHRDQVPIGYENIESLKAILALMVKNFDFVIVDVGHIIPSLLYFFFIECDALLLIGNPDVPSLKGLISLVKRLNTMKCDLDKVKIIINRYNSKNQVDIREFEKVAGRSVDCCVPNNYPICIQAVNRGEPICKIATKSDITKKIDELVISLSKLLDTRKPEENNFGLSSNPQEPKKGNLW